MDDPGSRRSLWHMTLAVGAIAISPAYAQHADDNAVRAADDAFGITVGAETIGLYNSSQVRGFSPQSAGNMRMEGLYFDQQAGPSSRIVDGSAIRVGISALQYPFPAPSGIVDYGLRVEPPNTDLTAVISRGPFETIAASFDGQLSPVTKSLTIPLGVGYGFYADIPEDTYRYFTIGASPLWKPAEGLTVRFLVDYWTLTDVKTQPAIYPRTGQRPSKIDQGYFGQDWTNGRYIGHTFGAIVHASLPGLWRLSAGLFRSEMDNQVRYSDLYTDAIPDGFARHLIIGYPGSQSSSTSGEVRISRKMKSSRLTHEIIAMIRGRDVRSSYGGADVHDFGFGDYRRVAPLHRPQFFHSPLTRDRSGLLSGGIAYQGGGLGGVSWSSGLQREVYKKQVSDPQLFTVDQTERLWRGYVSMSAPLARSVDVYASFTQGLEDSGVAPPNANNRNAVLPATRTRQCDAGLRFKGEHGLSALVGVFDIRKPYFNLSPSNYFVVLGEERHRGIELSVSADPGSGLHVLAGMEMSRPAVTSNVSAPSSLAVGQPDRIAQLSLDWSIPAMHSVSMDTTVTNWGPRAANVNNSLVLPSRTDLAIGVRYRFRFGASRALLRVQVDNALNSFAWQVGPGGGFTPYPGRNVAVYLAVDR